MRSSDYSVDAEQKINWKVFQIVWPYLVEYRSRIVLALAFLIFSKGASVSGPFLLKYIVDTLSENGVSGLVMVPVALVLAYGFARFSMIILGEIRDTIFGRVTERAMSKIGLLVFKHVHSLD